MRTILVLAVASLLLASCGSPQPDMTALKKTIEEYNAASIEAMKSGNSDKVLTYYTEDAMEMAPNMAMFKGKAAIKDFQAQMAKSGMKINDAKFTSVDIDAGGKVAYEVGTYEMTMTMGNAPSMNDKGKYIAIWKLQEDGSWKVSAETWNSDMPGNQKKRKNQQQKSRQQSRQQKKRPQKRRRLKRSKVDISAEHPCLLRSERGFFFDHEHEQTPFSHQLVHPSVHFRFLRAHLAVPRVL
ncbi:MAG: hypothetical protein HW374_1332 [Bacteroidetes bacterium]|nr:hypothetical protein [Bacteroidota bacterium]